MSGNIARTTAAPVSTLRVARLRSKVPTLVLYTLLTIGAVIMIVPFVWMISSSLKGLTQIFLIPPVWIPNPPIWSNYPDAFNALPFGRAYFNSFVIAFVVVASTLLTSSMAAYAFARIQFPFRDTLFVLFLAMLMVPGQVTIIPLFLIMKNIGLINTLWSIIVPFSLFNAFGVFLLRQFIKALPGELEEAAYVDGANRWTIYRRVILPLIKPALSALGIFTFMGQWNSFFYPLIMLSSPTNFTVPLMLNQFRGEYTVNWALMMAASAIAVIPVLIVYIVGQRYIIEGIAMTGLKG